LYFAIERIWILVHWPRRLRTYIYQSKNNAKSLEAAFGIEPNPRGEFYFRNFTGGQAEYRLNGFWLRCDQFVVIDRQEDTERVKSSAFVSVHKRMIFGYAKSIASGQVGYVRCRFVQKTVPRPSERGV
jgi:hypothetical protein